VTCAACGKLLDGFKGVGEVAVNIFFREAQLPQPTPEPWRARGRWGFQRIRRNWRPLFGAAASLCDWSPRLIRVELEHKQDEILAAAR